MSDTPTPAQDSAEQLKRAADEIRSGTMSPPEMALKLVIVMRRAIKRVGELEQQQRQGAEALETLESFRRRLNNMRDTLDTLSRHSSLSPVAQELKKVRREQVDDVLAMLAPTREGRS